MQVSSNELVGEMARRFRRFNIECSVLVQYQTGGTTAKVEAFTKNVSIGGILIISAIVIPLHTSVSFGICIRKRKIGRNINLAGEGRVVRVECAEGRGEAMIAVQCDVPLTHLEENHTYPSKYNWVKVWSAAFRILPGAGTEGLN